MKDKRKEWKQSGLYTEGIILEETLLPGFDGFSNYKSLSPRLPEVLPPPFDCTSIKPCVSSTAILPELGNLSEISQPLQIYKPGEYLSPEAKERGRNRCVSMPHLVKDLPNPGNKKEERQKLIRYTENILEKEFPLRASAGQLYLCEDSTWKPVNSDQLWQYLRSSNMPSNIDVESFTMYEVKDLYRRLVTNGALNFEDEHGTPLDSQEKIINLKDICFNVTTLKVVPQDPTFFFTTKLDISQRDIMQSAAPNFEEFARTSLNGDENLRQLLLEILGTLLSNYRPKNIFAFCGASNSGKSVIVDFLRWVLGVSAITQIAHLRDFSSRWTIGNLKGKKLLVCTECADEAIGADACAVIKTITGEPILTGEQKHKDATTFANTTRLLLVSNHLVHLDRVDAGFTNRLVSLPFPCSIPFEEQDPNLLEHLLDEKGAIFNMAMQAVHALAARNFEYTTVDSGYLDKVSDQTLYVAENFDIGVQNFVTCCCALDTDGYTTSSDLYNAYREYANAQQFPIFKKVDMFCKVLYRLFPTLKAQKKYVNGKQCRCIKGIAIQIPSNAETHSEQEDISHE